MSKAEGKGATLAKRKKGGEGERAFFFFCRKKERKKGGGLLGSTERTASDAISRKRNEKKANRGSFRVTSLVGAG